MVNWLLRCMLLLVCLASFAAQTQASEKRVALVIGNSSYEHVSTLPNPGNDAQDLSKALTRLGFDVTSGTDMDFTDMRLALRDFGEKAADADVALIYFAGHGIEIDKTNYLIPVNAQLRSDRDVDFEAIRLDTVIGSLEDAKGVRIVLLDACRNNPFLADMERTTASRSIGRGLSRIDPGGVLVGYAARGGTIALDGDGRNSPYAKALLANIEQPGLEIGKLFRRVRDMVLSETGGFQEPFTYGSLPGSDIFLVPPTPVAAALPAPQGQVIPDRLVEDFAKAEKRGNLTAWNTFLEDHGMHEDNGLVRIAMARQAALLKEKERLARSANRKPLLEPEFDQTGRAILNREDAKLVQTALSYMGHYKGPMDGDIGPMTRQAISAARFANRLPPGTHIDRLLLAALPDVAATDALKSDRARKYSNDELPVGMEPRLEKALRFFAGPYGRLPVLFDYFDGHLYIVVQDTSGTFESANRNAILAGGHLVTIQSAAENRFLVDLFSKDPVFMRRDEVGSVYGPMIGLFQPEGSVEPRGGWAWTTGEPLSYTAWSRGNPDNHEGLQHQARFYVNQRQARSTGGIPRFWDDTRNNMWSLGYIVEIE